jgi:hypothetical protein
MSQNAVIHPTIDPSLIVRVSIPSQPLRIAEWYNQAFLHSNLRR